MYIEKIIKPYFTTETTRILRKFALCFKYSPIKHSSILFKVLFIFYFISSNREQKKITCTFTFHTYSKINHFTNNGF